MAVYVMSDIHGEYDRFCELLKIIDLKDDDLLYILGDVVDRGPNPIKILLKLMKMPNVICLVGNHELMALECLKFLMKEISDMSIEELDAEMLDNILTWQINGSSTTIAEFRKLTPETQQEVIDFIREFLIWEELTVNGKDYLLVHAGLDNFSPEKDIEDYSLHDLVWADVDYEKPYFEDITVINGHTPTQTITGNPRPGYIYKKNNHIDIDCGACFEGGRLAALCLDTGEEFYTEAKKEKEE